MSARNPQPRPDATDIIGDVHGHADALFDLLHDLGYRRRSTVWQHPEGRQAVFVGDLIDGGPDARGVLETVAAMMEAGQARCVMGNHEYRALLHHQTGPDGVPLRRMSGRQLASHETTLSQLANPHPEEWEGWLQWMQQLPLWLDAGSFRVVHACWDHQAVAFLIQSRLTRNLLRAAAHAGPEQESLETLLQGPVLTEHPQGPPLSRPVRLRWWAALKAGTELGAASLDPLLPQEARLPLPEEALPDPYPEDAVPLFVGHYSGRGGPSMKLTSNVICVDAGVVHGGKLAAFRVDQALAITV